MTTFELLFMTTDELCMTICELMFVTTYELLFMTTSPSPRP